MRGPASRMRTLTPSRRKAGSDQRSAPRPEPRTSRRPCFVCIRAGASDAVLPNCRTSDTCAGCRHAQRAPLEGPLCVTNGPRLAPGDAAVPGRRDVTLERRVRAVPVGRCCRVASRFFKKIPAVSRFQIVEPSETRRQRKEIINENDWRRVGGAKRRRRSGRIAARNSRRPTVFSGVILPVGQAFV